MAGNMINRILVVDDDKVNLKIVEGLLHKRGVAVDTCSSGRDAIQMAECVKYDIIILDHMMPEMSGVEVLCELRKGGGPNRDTYTVVLTANVDNGLRERYCEAGFDEYLTKPLTMDCIDTLLEGFVNRISRESATDEEKAGPDLKNPVLNYLHSNGFDVEAGMSFTKGNIVLLQDLLAMFADRAEETISKLESYKNSGEFQYYRKTCENQRVTAKSVGATALYNRFYKHIMAAANGEHEWIDNDFDDLAEVWRSYAGLAGISSKMKG